MNVADPYADRQLADEATHRSLTLCKAIISNPNTDPNIRIGCLAKCISLLDTLPKVRDFDVQAVSEAKHKMRSTNAESKDPSIWPPQLMQILLDRATILKDLATAYRQNGDAQNAAYNFDRAVTLLESLIQTSHLSLAEANGDTKTVARNTLLQVLGDWADIEQSLGRNAKAAKIRMRVDKWRFSSVTTKSV
ncbi:hypothetical protein H4S04_004786 [Coemansia sp. S16]|nr:hypothetical protein H4S04_004786 [Coemansia sp. S16]KAJ2349277.1 hypothetical protein GGH92_002581 [Coemansia sp. RSA 2673]